MPTPRWRASMPNQCHCGRGRCHHGPRQVRQIPGRGAGDLKQQVLTSRARRGRGTVEPAAPGRRPSRRRADLRSHPPRSECSSSIVIPVLFDQGRRVRGLRLWWLPHRHRRGSPGEWSSAATGGARSAAPPRCRPPAARRRGRPLAPPGAYATSGVIRGPTWEAGAGSPAGSSTRRISFSGRITGRRRRHLPRVRC
jgi:hypothetical protein